MDRREFLLSTSAMLAMGCTHVAGRESVLPSWQEGELDIHFIHTGVGEQTFFIFPDGTSMLVDCGDYQKRDPEYAKFVPAMPSSRMSGGEWVARYIKRMIDRREIDYVMVSHWHDDHVLGLADIAKSFSIGVWTDHQFPKHGDYGCRGTDAESLKLASSLIPLAGRAVPFEVGAENQFYLRNDLYARRYGNFAIRNLAANCVLWDGKSGKIDFAGPHLQATHNKKGILENMLSSAFRIDYGDFSYYSGGDVEKSLINSDGSEVDWEEQVGMAAGKVAVCKTNHHAYWDAMHEGFVRQIRARAYLSSVWSPSQVNNRSLSVMMSKSLYPGERMVYYGFIPHGKGAETSPFVGGISPMQGHFVVRVAPGGHRYVIYTLDASDESMRVIDRQDYEVVSPTSACRHILPMGFPTCHSC